MRSFDNISCLLFDTSFILTFGCLPCVPTLIDAIKNSTFFSWLFYSGCGGQDKIELSKEKDACQALAREFKACIAELKKGKEGSWVTVPGTSAEVTFDAGLEARIFNRMMDACEKNHIVITQDHPYSSENMEKKASSSASKAPKSWFGGWL